MTIHLPDAVQRAITFLGTHLTFWVILVALVLEFRYLLHKDRREAIAMTGWGAASRIKQPAKYYFLWVLHVVAALFFSLLFIGYLLRQL